MERTEKNMDMGRQGGHMEKSGINLWQKDYVQTLGLGGGGTSSAGGFLFFSFCFSCLITHCELDR